MQWATGLTITTTGLDKFDKEAIRQDVEAAGGRYSPNLSKRTTHLVTPEVVSNPTEKLTAAAGGQGQQRFKALQVVSKCWVSASAGLRCRACETQFAPLLPPPSKAGATVVRHDSRSSTAAGLPPVSHTTPQAAATAGPQAPWVVHFSQLPDDSVYGAQQQQHESPSAVRQLAQQLHCQLSPISEAFSQEQGTAANMQPSPEWNSGGRLQAKRQREEATAVLPAAQGDAWQQPLPTTSNSASSPWQPGGRSSDTTPAAVPLQQTWQLSAGCKHHTPLQQQSSEQQQQEHLAAADYTAAGGANATAGGSAWHAAHGAETGAVSPKSRVRPPVLKLPLRSDSSNTSSSQGVSDVLRAPANSTTGWGHAASHSVAQPGTYVAPAHPDMPQQQKQHAQQQPQQGVNNQEPWAPEGVPLRGLKRVSTQGYSSLGEAAEAEASAERERRSTAENLQQHRELLQQQLQLTRQNLHQQRQPDWLHQQRQQHGDTQVGAAASASGSSNVSELIAALQRVTGDSRRATAETAPSNFTAAAATGNTGTSPPSSHSLHCLGTSGNLSARFDAAADAAAAAASGAQPSDGSGVPASKSSIESLLQSLRGLSDRTAPQAPAAQTQAEGWSAGARSAGPLPLLGVVPVLQQQTSFGTAGAAPQPGCSSLDTNIPQEEQPQQQQRQQAVYWGSAGGRSSTVHTVPGSSVTSTGGAGPAAVAAQSSSQGPPSPLDLDQLLSMLHRATGDSRRGTTETAASSSSGVVGGSCAGASVLQSVLQDSRRATADAAVGGNPANFSSNNAGQAVPATAAPAGTHVAYAVAEAAAVPLPLSQDAAPAAAGGAGQAGPQLPQWAVDYGWGSGVAAPEHHRDHATAGMQLSGSHGGASRHQREEQQHLPLQLQGTGVSQPHSEPQQHHVGSAAGSGSSVADLIAALRRATGESRRSTWEVAPAGTTATPAAATDSDDAAAGDVDVDPSRRDAGRPEKPHLSLKLPSDNTAFDAKAQTQGQGQAPVGLVYPQTQLTEHARVTPNAEHPDSRAGSSGGGSNGSNAQACSSSANGSSSNEGSDGIDGLLNALQCIAVANKLQEAAAMAPEVAVVAQCHVAALERQVDQMPGSEYAALVSKLSLKLSELNKQGLQDLQQQQGLQQQQLGPEYGQQDTAGAVRQASVYGAAADTRATATAGAAVGPGTAAGPAAGEEGDVFGSMSSGSQELQQLVAALRRVTAEKEAADSSGGAGPQHHTAPAGQDSRHAAEQALPEVHAQLQCGLQHQQVLQVPGAYDTGVPGSVQEASAVQAASAEGNGGYGSCSSIEALLSALQATSNRQAHNFAAAGAGSPEPGVLAASSNGQQHKGPEQQLSPQEQEQQQQPWNHARNDQHADKSGVPAGSRSSNGTSVQDLLVALRRATESKRWEGAEAVPEPAIEPAVEPHDCSSSSSSDGTKDSSSRSAEQQTEEPGERGAGVSELTVDGLPASASGHSQQQPGAGPTACAASSPCTVACASAVAAEGSPAASAAQITRQSQKADALQQPCLPGSHASTSAAQKPSVGSGPAGMLDFAAMSVVFDSRVPQGTKAQLSEALAAQGATVLTGQPHLGCGANTVVAEPEGAGALLPLLLDIVSPLWLAKALRRQQQGQGPGQVLQQAVAISPDVARAIGLQLQHSAAHTAGIASGSLRQPSGSTGAAAGSGKGLDGRSGSGSPKEQPQQPQVPVLVVPHGYAVTCAGDNMPVVLEEVQSRCQQQQQTSMMPAVLLTDQLWSVGQHPRMVAEEELDAVVLPAWCSSTITLLLPQCSSSLLGHAAITCPASDPAKGLTCGNVLAAVHDFYQQEVLLQPEADAQAGAAGSRGTGRSGAAGDGSAEQSTAQGGTRGAASGSDGLGSQVVGQQGDAGSRPGRVRVVKRLQLLGHKQMFEGLFRVTRDPCSSVYEVCLA